VPWAHLAFGLGPILALRSKRGGGASEGISTWGQLGLNRKRAEDFRRSLLGAGFELRQFDVIPVKGLSVLTHIPLIADLFIFGLHIDAVRPE
jgi:hypothetical protein